MKKIVLLSMLCLAMSQVNAQNLIKSELGKLTPAEVFAKAGLPSDFTGRMAVSTYAVKMGYFEMISIDSMEIGSKGFPDPQAFERGGKIYTVFPTVGITADQNQLMKNWLIAHWDSLGKMFPQKDFSQFLSQYRKDIDQQIAEVYSE